MRETFERLKMKPGTLAVIEQANQIIRAYAAQGFKLTVRQLYYQFVARDLIPNNQRSYKRLVTIVSKGRLAGLIDWNVIEDRTRSLSITSHWDNPGDIIWSAATSYRIDKWANQPNRIEVWVEKEALSGVIEPVCRSLDIGYFAARGYPSLSEFYTAGKRFARWAQNGQVVHVLHLGDHDPSGIDMTRDLMDRAAMFAALWIDVDRLALNFDQIELYRPPPNFAKMTDSRYQDYADRYGRESWELDALDPNVIADLISNAVMALRDDAIWLEDAEREAAERDALREAADNWGNVADFLAGNGHPEERM